MNEWIYFKSDYAVGAIELKNNRVVNAPPIWKKWIGMDFDVFKKKFYRGYSWSILKEPPKEEEIRDTSGNK